jgi:hypothetical protein
VAVVFLWLMCGEMCGKDGQQIRSFSGAKILQIFEVYFFEGRTGWAGQFPEVKS